MANGTTASTLAFIDRCKCYSLTRPYDVEWERVDTAASYLAALDRNPDVILADYTLPQYGAPDALLALRERRRAVPFIVVTGAVGEEKAEECIRNGADDYLLKDRLTWLAPAVARALDEKRLLAAQMVADESRRKTEQLLERIFASIRDAMLIVDGTTRTIINCNPAASVLFGYSRDQVVGQSPAFLHALEFDFEAFVQKVDTDLRSQGYTFAPCLWMRRIDGSTFPVELAITAVEGEPAESSTLIVVMRNISARLEIEEALRNSEGRFRSFVKGAIHGIYRSTSDGRFAEVNEALVRMLGYASETELLDTPVAKLCRHPSERAALIDQYSGQDRIEGIALEWLRKDGRPITVRLSGRLRTSQEVDGGGFNVIVEDITERRSIERQLRQAQKMEALGRLAGGVAHDFNNLLTAILGFSELLLRLVPAADPIHADVKQIHDAGQSAAALTRQLLAFSRKQENRPEVLDLQEVVRSIEKMLRRVLGEDITVVITGTGGSVRADRSQLEQILMNLAVNARDAMPQGGTLTIDVSPVPRAAPGNTVAPGEDVALTITNTGCGMSDEVKAHLFEPFFTTKPPDKGTGLGLATTYAAVMQNNGRIEVDSQAGCGTTVRICLPGANSSVSKNGGTAAPRRRRHLRARTVLLVDDEKYIRVLGRRLLTDAGYDVFKAGDGSEALRVAAAHAGPIHLLLTDVVMRGINGRVLFDQLRLTRPDIAVLYMSGYAPGGLLDRGFGDRDAPLVSKPFTTDALLKAVGQCCAARKTRRSGAGTNKRRHLSTAPASRRRTEGNQDGVS